MRGRVSESDAMYLVTYEFTECVIFIRASSKMMNVIKMRVFNAGIAQLGEQQTEVLEVACSIHAPGISFSLLMPLLPVLYG